MTGAAGADATERAAQPDLVNDLARFTASTDAAWLDPAVVAAAKASILDTLSCAVAGSCAPGIAGVTSLIREWGGTAQADVFEFDGKFPVHHAAWANAGMSHACDYDDTARRGGPARGRVVGANSTRCRLANAGAELQNCIKQAAEFGSAKGGQLLATLLLGRNEVLSIGQDAKQCRKFAGACTQSPPELVAGNYSRPICVEHRVRPAASTHPRSDRFRSPPRPR